MPAVEVPLPPSVTAQQIPNGPPRVHWVEINGALPGNDGALPGIYEVSIRQTHARTSADGHGDVYVVYQLTDRPGTASPEDREAQVVTISAHDKILNEMLAEHAGDPDIQYLIHHAYAAGMLTERLGFVHDQEHPE